MIEGKFGKIPEDLPKEMHDEYERLYMGDKEYLKLLEKIVEKVNDPNFKPKFFDCTDIGQKETWSNCGLCNESDYSDESTWTTKENAKFPDQLPSRRAFKDFRNYQQCPFDWRKNPDFTGCFYTCYLFQNKRSSIKIESLRRMAKKKLDEMKKLIKLTG